MNTLPVTDLRSNVGTWSVLDWQLPALTKQMLDILQPERYDPSFAGQYLETTYFDTRDFALRKARVKGKKYITIRIRCYSPGRAASRHYSEPVYAISAKTESKKVRNQIDGDIAEALLGMTGVEATNLSGLLPADVIARIAEISRGDPLVPVVTLCFQRFAVEDDRHRLTLDVDIHSDTGRRYPCHVLEQKSTSHEATPLISLPLRPIKLSKFLWSTS
jgi:hypothetical protein